MKITQGKWKATHNKQGAYNYLVQADAIMIANLVDLPNVFGSSQDHAKLLADAGNTYQATNKLPSELAEANKELLDALKSILKSHRQMSFEKDGNLNDTFIETKIDNLIKKHSNA